MGLDEVFKVLSKGVMVSLNSKKYLDVASFLMIDENFDELSILLDKIGFKLNGENGYFYISKKENMNEAELHSFLQKHKNILVAVAILKQVLPYIDKGNTVKQTEFTYQYLQKDNTALAQKFEYIFDTKDLKDIVERFFGLLEKAYILEQKERENKDEYLVLSSIEYYLNIVERVV
ncbi:hypothetical protein MNB_SV-13-1458 [hydrothermal vent metagenome]|uniref:Uncharacterized protein n=1 Tax=hydrothermal vent metagenome TaxID=652676 RepID=A0A1W1BWB1_9ZZZZ